MKVIFPQTKITTHVVSEGESIEEMLRRQTAEKAPIIGNARLTYNDRKDGVLAQHDIRTDRFEIAIMATDKIHAAKAAQRLAQDTGKPLAEQAETTD